MMPKRRSIGILKNETCIFRNIPNELARKYGAKSANRPRSQSQATARIHATGKRRISTKWPQIVASLPLGQPAVHSRKKRLRHLLTICRGVSSLAAMSSLASPAAAYSTIVARISSRYDDVYLRAVASRRARSAADNSMRYGHFLGMNVPPWMQGVAIWEEY